MGTFWIEVVQRATVCSRGGEHVRAASAEGYVKINSEEKRNYDQGDEAI